MPLYLQGCLPHTSFLGFFVALSSNGFPYLGEILYLFYSYNTTTYVNRQEEKPSFWFRRWRPGFLITGILYDVGMLAYCIYIEDMFAVLVVVRIILTVSQLRDQLWMIKNWIPFFVQKEKRQFLFVRLFIMDCLWNLMVGTTSWTNTDSWRERNDIFANVFYMNFFVLTFGCGLWYLIQGGVNHLVKYRFHWTRNTFVCLAFVCMILGIVGLIFDDGGGDNLANTLNYHSAFVMIYFGINCQIAVIMQRFIIFFEELAWKQPNSNPNPMPDTPLSFRKEANTSEVANGFVPSSNKVACDVNVNVEVLPFTLVEFASPPKDIPKETVVVSPPEIHIKGTIDDTKQPTNEDEKVGNGDGDLEAAYASTSQSDTVSACDVARTPTIVLSQIMMMRLKRHELVCREIDKLFCIFYQMFVWETIMWLAQIFLTLYLQSVNTPTLPDVEGYYCVNPLQRILNSVAFVNDVVFARR